ncbi:MAG: carboxymuconolactone decarboxylase family protein [Candidatus Solibacter sp.]|nr:carboxymuconolactone decarboxylase family protein [Candidatus Solibacter sp.]
MQSIRSALYHVTRLGAVAGVLGYPVSLGAQQPRFPQIKLEDTSGDQRAMADRMLKETRVGLGGPWNVMLRSPTVAQGMMDLYNYFRWKSALPARLVEFGILITSREWSVPYEWYIHYPLALKEGVAAATLAEVRAGKRPAAATADEAAAYDLAIELLRNHVVSQPTFQKAKAVLGEKALVDLTALVGTYVAIGGLLNVSEVGGPDKEGPEYLPKPRVP